MVRYFSVLSLLFYLSFQLVVAQPLTIAVMSDIHYMSDKLVVGGGNSSEYELSTGRQINVMHEVLNKALDSINSMKPDILLITGDMTNHGERQSHMDFIKKIEYLKDGGIRVLVVPGNHDINIPNAKKYINNSSIPTDNISEEEFLKLYRDFGYSDALDRDKGSLSYLSELNRNTWLIAFDSNLHREYQSNSITRGRISNETMSWALNIIKVAKARGITVMGMMHHGLAEHMPYQATFFADYLIDDWQLRAQQLADKGMKIMLTGHFHANDVTLFTSKKGNEIYDIETGSMAHYPFPFRILKLNEDVLSISTYNISQTPSAPNLLQDYQKKYEVFSRRAIRSKINNIGIPFTQDVGDALVELLVNMSLLHAAGDEVLNTKTKQFINVLGDVLGDDSFDSSTFNIDFPPADNNLQIILR